MDFYMTIKDDKNEIVCQNVKLSSEQLIAVSSTVEATMPGK